MNLVTTRSPYFGSGRTLRVSARRRRDMFYYLLRTFGAVERAPLPAVLDALGVEDAAQDVVADAGQVLHAAAADQHHRVLLQIVALAGDVAHRLDARGEAHLGHLPQGGVRLLRRHRVDAGAHPAALRRALQGRHLVAPHLGDARLADQLVDRRHSNSIGFLVGWGSASLVGPDKHETAPNALAPKRLGECVAARQRSKARNRSGLSRLDASPAPKRRG